MKRVLATYLIALCSYTSLSQYSPSSADSVLTYNMYVNTGRIRINTQFFNVFDSLEAHLIRINNLFNSPIVMSFSSSSPALSLNQNNPLFPVASFRASGSDVFSISATEITAYQPIVASNINTQSITFLPQILYPKLMSVGLSGVVSAVSLHTLLSAGNNIILTTDISTGIVTINSSGGGGGSVPSGDGFYHVTSGSQDAAARAVNLSTTDVTNILPIANGGTNSNTALNNNRFMISSGGRISENPAVTGLRVLVSDAAGLPIASTVTSATLAFLDIPSSLSALLFAKQDLDLDLSSIAGQSGVGYLVRTASNTYLLRTLVAGANMSITASDGASGNSTIGIGPNVALKQDIVDSSMRVIGSAYDVPHIVDAESLMYGSLRDSVGYVLIRNSQLHVQKKDTVVRLGTRANKSENVIVTATETNSTTTTLSFGSQIANFTFNINGTFTVNGAPVTGSGSSDGQDADSIRGKPVDSTARAQPGHQVTALVYNPDSGAAGRYQHVKVTKLDTTGNNNGVGKKLYYDPVTGTTKVGNDSTSALAFPVTYPVYEIPIGYFANAAGDLTGASSLANESDNTNDWTTREMQFDENTKNYASAIIHMPSDWDSVTAPKFKIVSYASNSNALTTAYWGMSAAWLTTGSWQSALGTEVYATQTYTVANAFQKTAISPTPSGTAAPDAWIRVRIMRNSDHASDTFNDKTKAVEVLMQYKKSTYGITTSW